MTAVAERTRKHKLPRLRWVNGSEGRSMLDRQARRLLGISGEEFLRRWDAGEFAAQFDDPEHPEIRRLERLIRFAR